MVWIPHRTRSSSIGVPYAGQRWRTTQPTRCREWTKVRGSCGFAYIDRMASHGASELIVAGGRELTISNPEKVLFPAAGYTKRDLVNYYLAVAEGALRGSGNRPNVLVRYPDGIGG